MANALDQNPMKVDTASATALFPATVRLYIKGVRWVGATNAAHTAVITDAAGDAVWNSVANAANYVESDSVDDWVDGLVVPTLGSGILYIQLN